jgi:DNA-binding helix-hairpin-helix protein with protein kinase domain
MVSTHKRTATLKSPPRGLPASIELSGETKHGGEADVYFSSDGRYAVKIYKSVSSDRERLLLMVMKLFENVPSAQEHFILPPLALVDSLGGKRRMGFVMRRVPSTYRELGEVALSPLEAAEQFRAGRKWPDYLKVARAIAEAVTVLHGSAHTDIHFRNFLVSLKDGESVMLEIDGIAVPGYIPARAIGLPGFVAPEVLTRGEDPSEVTDRHSLAVLVLHTLLFHNVMRPLRDFDSDPDKSDALGWGTHALFSEDPTDRANQPQNLGIPLYRGGALSIDMLTPGLRRLATRALIDGLRRPELRPTAREWRDALALAIDELWSCARCLQHFPLASHVPAARRHCPFCGEVLGVVTPVVLKLHRERSRGDFASTGRDLVLGPGFGIYADVFSGLLPPLSRNETPIVGRLTREEPRGLYALENLSHERWTETHPHRPDTRNHAERGDALPIINGSQVHFGNDYLARVAIPT